MRVLLLVILWDAGFFIYDMVLAVIMFVFFVYALSALSRRGS